MEPSIILIFKANLGFINCAGGLLLEGLLLESIITYAWVPRSDPFNSIGFSFLLFVGIIRLFFASFLRYFVMFIIITPLSRTLIELWRMIKKP